MAANSDGHTELTTVLTCEGNLSDPKFPVQLDVVVGRLNDILGDQVKVRKLEPWNSVRVTLSIPREAALRLRQLANEGSQQLRALGILSVQIEGDQVISLRLATGAVNSEPQEIILRTAQDGGNTDRRESDLGLSFLSTSGSAAINPNNSQVQFKSPNVVCPPDSVVPRVGTSAATSNNVSSSGKAFAGPFPFASMNQAIHSNRETPFNALPPPYPGKHPPVTISSPLLVNLLQNDGPKESSNVSKLPQSVASARSIRTPPVSVHKPVAPAVTVSTNSNNSTFVKPNPTSTQANVLVNNSISPSALSTNTSIRQNSTILTSTTVAVNKTPPPQYHRPLSTTMTVKQQPLSGFSNATNATSISSQVNSLTQTSLLSQQNCSPVSQISNITQTNIFHSQSQTKNPLPQINHPAQNSVSSQNISQPVLSPPQSNVPLSQQNLSKNHSVTNITLPQMKAAAHSVLPAPQTKNVLLNNLLPQPPNISVLSQLKSPLPQGISVTKNVNSFLSRPIKNPASNFSQPSALNTSLSQPNAISQTTTLSSNFSAISTASLSNSTDSVTNSVSIPTQSQPSLNSVMSRSLPSPPPYSVAISRPWDTLVHSNNSILDLTPSITDLKPDVLDELLPTLERELSHSPLPELPEDFLNVPSNIISTPPSAAPAVEDNRKFLINPLTGELEPHSGGESDTEELKDVFTGLPSPAALSDDDTSSTTRPDATTDHSDNEARSNDAIKPRLKNPKVRDRGRDSPALKQEKIKLRLKLEKSEPINPAYKVDVSFINTQPKKAAASMMSTAGEELRVPPLHISLRGRNSVVIKNKNKLNPDGTPMKPKVRKNQDIKMKKNDNSTASMNEELSVNATGPTLGGDPAIEQLKNKMNNLEQKKFKKFKATHEHQDMVTSLSENDIKSKFIIHNHYKDKQKERRGSDSELVRNNKKYVDSNGIICDEKKRRLSQAEQVDEEKPPVLGSTNVGTITGLPQKSRKDKMKIKDIFKKDVGRNKIFTKNFGDKLQNKQVTLPTAGEMNMEAKFKQGLLEGTAEKGVLRPPHRTEVVNHITAESNRTENTEKVAKIAPDVTSLKDKSPEPDKCNTPDRKSVELSEKQTAVTGGRSPNSGAGQGEDSGIESMDALSEKSPNQASQSPHADILPPKTQVPIMLDIEAQLAKMEGLNGDTDRGGGNVVNANATEDVNENKCHHDQSSKLKQCCELTCALQDSLKQGAVSLTATLSPPTPPAKQQAEINLVSLKVKKEENLEPLPVRVTPALYTYSNQNPEKGRGGSESPTLSDEDSNSCSTNSTMNSSSKQNRSLLEQLLIEIPNDHQAVPSSPSPATRSSVRTRALSKLGSPELSSPVTKNTRTMAPTKRKRNESDSSNHSLEEGKKKPRKASETVLDTVKTRQNDPTKAGNVKKTLAKVQQDESSDSDEPLIEKLRKPSNSINTHAGNVAAKSKVKSGAGVAANNAKTVVMNTRRSVRSNMPAQNTRSRGDKTQSESEALRRKTRSAVSDVESKRKKEVK